jgi:catechol 2,3-dioxygenase-like lactoylglutathione lyase family enzyme
MKFKSIQKGIITNRLKESKDFYLKFLGFQVKVEMDWFLLLHLPENPDYEIAFMLPNLDLVRKPYFQKPYAGQGAWLILETSNVHETYEALKLSKAPIDLELTEEDWGDIHFTLIDPNGIGIDIVQHRLE